MRAVDTNLLVRILSRDDPTQLAAAEAFIAGGAWVSHLVLVEAIWVLGSVFGREPSFLAASIRMLLEHEALVLQDPDVVEAALKHFSKQTALGFSDCLILEVARKAGHLPVGSFDRDFSKLEGVQKV
jgi:predicted nucleic-acid-binding protein